MLTALRTVIEFVPNYAPNPAAFAPELYSYCSFVQLSISREALTGALELPSQTSTSH